MCESLVFEESRKFEGSSVSTTEGPPPPHPLGVGSAEIKQQAMISLQGMAYVKFIFYKHFFVLFSDPS